MGCCWVNYIVRIDRGHGNFFVICPTCGRWGTIFKKSKARLAIRHRDDTRCGITWNRGFEKFAENIYNTVFRINVRKLKSNIREGLYVVDGYEYTLRCVPNGVCSKCNKQISQEAAGDCRA